MSGLWATWWIVADRIISLVAPIEADQATSVLYQAEAATAMDCTSHLTSMLMRSPLTLFAGHEVYRGIYRGGGFPRCAHRSAYVHLPTFSVHLTDFASSRALPREHPLQLRDLPEYIVI